jgi:hypothetical protein
MLLTATTPDPGAFLLFLAALAVSTKQPLTAASKSGRMPLRSLSTVSEAFDR